MSTNNPRPTTSDLRRRLLTATPSPTPSAPAIAEVLEEPPLPPSLARRLAESARMAPPAEAPAPQVEAESNRQVGRRTPLPTSSLEAQTFLRAKPEQVQAGDELSQLRAQNNQLRQGLEEIQLILEEAQQQEQTRIERELQLNVIIEERDSLIQQLEEQVNKLDHELANRRVPKDAEELTEWEDELERESARIATERKKLEDERNLMEEDEDELQKQMREMEVAMARERAMMARQESDLKRLSAEIHQELEQMAKGDATLREQMQKFQRRHQEILARGAGLSGPAFATSHTPPAPSPHVATPAAPLPVGDDKKDGSLFKRIFGK